MGGVSNQRLTRLHDAAKASVERGEITGAITLIERGDDIDINITGLADRERNLPMQRDTIFRLASMTKPITGAAAMILVEEGKLRLDEPIDRLVPELANRKVLTSMDGPVDDTVPAKRPITLRDCLTFRLGHGVLGLGPPTTPIGKAMAEAGLGFGGAAVSPEEWIKRLGTLPLLHQPGERVLYNTGSDVAGLMIARASGMPFSQFVKERMFEPLGMKDTGFFVLPEKLERFSSCYAFNFQKRELELQDDARASARFNKAPIFESGGGGLVSTLDDYHAFGRMMLNHGKLRGTRVLSRVTVETMATDYLTAEQKRTSGWFPGVWDGRGWGLGVAVITDRISVAHSPGRFGWDGAFGTQWWADPRENMNMLLMVQRAGGPSSLGMDFLTLAYQAIDD